ncbi:MAG: SNF2-related protein [Vicingaceae bacterium]
MKKVIRIEQLEGEHRELWIKEILKYNTLEEFLTAYRLDEQVDTAKVASLEMVKLAETAASSMSVENSPPQYLSAIRSRIEAISEGKPIPLPIFIEKNKTFFPDSVIHKNQVYATHSGFPEIAASNTLKVEYIPAIVYRHVSSRNSSLTFDNSLPMESFLGVDLTAIYQAVQKIAEERKSKEKSKIDLLNNGNYFQENEEFVLGKPYQASNAYGQEVTKIKGSISEIKQQKELELLQSDDGEIEVTETVLKPSIDDLVVDQKAEANIKKALKQSKTRYKSKLKESNNDFELTSFEEIIQNYNADISEEEISAWIWYKRQSDSYNKVNVILNENNGWSKYIVFQSAEKEHLEKWLKSGVMCYHKGDYIPSVLYYAENIYVRKTELLREQDEIIKKFGKEQYERQLNGLNQAMPKALNLTDSNLDNRLVIKPISDFARSYRILELADGTKFNNYYSARDGNETASLTTAFAKWLAQQPTGIFEKSDKRSITRFYLEGRTPDRMYDAAQKLRMKQNAKIEGDKLFQQFLAEAILVEDQKKIEYLWNSKFNGYAPINYFKIPVAFNCSSTFKNKPLFIRPAQREGLGFIAANGGGCIAYDVGVGKTMTGILSIAHALENGMCSRPLIVVPNQTYKNWLNELRGVVNKKGEVTASGILPQYPINDLYNLGEKFIHPLLDEEGKVQEVPANSISVVTYEGLKRLSFNEDTWNDVGADFYRILNQGLESQKQATKLQEKIEELMGRGVAESVVNIEDLGFDYLLMDEAHIMKKLFTQVKGDINAEGSRNKTEYKISSGTPSAIALKGFMLANYVQRTNKMNNIVLLTATPFTNSPLEIFSMLTLIGYHRLNALSLGNLQQFFNHFIQTSIELIINAKLKPERKEIVMGFNNLIALQQLIFQFIDYKSGEEANIQRPNKWVLPLNHKRENGNTIPLPIEEQISTNLKPSIDQMQLMAELERYITGEIEFTDFCSNPTGLEEASEESGSESTALNEKNLADDEEEGARILRGITLGRQIAFSPYLFSCHSGSKMPSYKDFVASSPKLQYVMGCIKSVKNYFKDKGEPMSGQVIYSNAGISYFPLIKEYLIQELGFKDSEIDFIKGGMSARKKELVKEKFLDGRVKVLIGSQTIREGINLQYRATDLYNLWLDWNPTDLHQLEGRIWRFGNKFANVRIVIPLVEDSVDTAIFQKLEEKTSRINQIWHRSDRENTLKLEDFNPAELKRGLISNPRKIAEMVLLEQREILLDEIKGLENQRDELDSILTARTLFRENIENIKTSVAEYKPPKKGQDERKLETIFKIYQDYLEDDDTKYIPYGKEKLIEVKKAHRQIQQATERVLEPRGLDINFTKEEVVTQLEQEIELKNDVLAAKTDEEAIQLLTKEIIAEREKKGTKPKTIADRVAEFASINDIILSEKMVYEGTKEEETPVIPIEKSSEDILANMEKLLEDMEEMDKLLLEMEELKAASKKAA